MPDLPSDPTPQNMNCIHGRQRSICAICAPAADAEYARSSSAEPAPPHKSDEEGTAVCIRRWDPVLRQMVFEPLPESSPVPVQEEATPTLDALMQAIELLHNRAASKMASLAEIEPARESNPEGYEHWRKFHSHGLPELIANESELRALAAALPGLLEASRDVNKLRIGQDLLQRQIAATEDEARLLAAQLSESQLQLSLSIREREALHQQALDGSEYRRAVEQQNFDLRAAVARLSSEKAAVEAERDAWKREAQTLLDGITRVNEGIAKTLNGA